MIENRQSKLTGAGLAVLSLLAIGVMTGCAQRIGTLENSTLRVDISPKHRNISEDKPLTVTIDNPSGRHADCAERRVWFEIYEPNGTPVQRRIHLVTPVASATRRPVQDSLQFKLELGSEDSCLLLRKAGAAYADSFEVERNKSYVVCVHITRLDKDGNFLHKWSVAPFVLQVR